MINYEMGMLMSHSFFGTYFCLCFWYLFLSLSLYSREDYVKCFLVMGHKRFKVEGNNKFRCSSARLTKQSKNRYSYLSNDICVILLNKRNS